MANEKYLKGWKNAIVSYFDGTEFVTVACITSKNEDNAVILKERINTCTKGEVEKSVSGFGKSISFDAEATDQNSYEEIEALFDLGVEVLFNTFRNDNQERFFSGVITSLSKTADSNAGVTFNATIEINNSYQITFADPEVRSIILDKLGTETPTLAQVQAVTSVNGWFSVGGAGSEIATFYEFKYFTVESLNGIFESCYSLSEITLPSTITNIGSRCFFDTSLTNITIPSLVISLGDGCFYDCTSLTEMTFESIEPPILGAMTISTATTKIYVPDNSVQSYKDAPSWSDYISYIKPISEK